MMNTYGILNLVFTSLAVLRIVPGNFWIVYHAMPVNLSHPVCEEIIFF